MKKSLSPFAEMDIVTPDKSVKIGSITTKIQNEVPATPTTPPEEPVVTFEPYEAKVTVLLNVRSGPGFEHKIIGTLGVETIVKILKENDNWGRIGKDSWICLQYVQKI